MTFLDARRMLLTELRNRIHNGEWTERRFSQLIGISQPHAHNVLKGARTLSPQHFDLILKFLDLSLLDLASVKELQAAMRTRDSAEKGSGRLPFLSSAIGPGKPWPRSVDWRRACTPPFQWKVDPQQLVAVELVPDPHMYRMLGTCDIAILDTSPQARMEISPQRLYVIERPAGALLRSLRTGSRYCYLLTDLNSDRPGQWERVAWSSGQWPDLVKARVLWLGRERDRHLPLDQRGRILDDATSS